jgi:hypothetical protein
VRSAGAARSRLQAKAAAKKTEVVMVSEVLQGIIGLAVMLTVPAYFVLQPWAALKLTGGWRRAALAPLILAIPTILWSLYALSHESNLWPITFILFAPCGTIYLTAVLLLRRMAA